MKRNMKIAVIGGGASGMMAAIAAARGGARVVLYEGNDRVGKKLLATGNGRCNFSNTNLSIDNYYGEDKRSIQRLLHKFDTAASVSFFEKAGMLIKDKNGYLYPASGQASTVLDILRMQLKSNKVTVLTEHKVKNITKGKDGRFMVEAAQSKDGFDKIILACGSKAAPKTGSDGNGYRLTQSIGHSLIPIVPALVQLKCSEDLKAISGVRQEAAVTFWCDGKEAATERGELQFTDYGISGIVVFQFSRLATYGLQQKRRLRVRIDCLPEFEEAAYTEYIVMRKKNRQDAETVEDFFTGLLHKKLLLYFCKLAGLKPTDAYKSADKKKIDKVFSLCKDFTLTINGSNSYDNAQVCAGGVPLREVSENMESLLCRGVYLAGELLDVDGKCGGYNLQWAWASGYVAGSAAAEGE